MPDLLVIVPSRGTAPEHRDGCWTQCTRPPSSTLTSTSRWMRMTRNWRIVPAGHGRCGGPGDVLEVGPRKGLAAWTNEIAVRRAGEYPFLASLGDDMVPKTRALGLLPDPRHRGHGRDRVQLPVGHPGGRARGGRAEQQHRGRAGLDVRAVRCSTSSSMTSGRTWGAARAACATAGLSRWITFTPARAPLSATRRTRTLPRSWTRTARPTRSGAAPAWPMTSRRS